MDVGAGPCYGAGVMEMMEFYASAIPGTEKVLCEELRELGFASVRLNRGGIPFRGEPSEGWAWVTGEIWEYSKCCHTEPTDADSNDDVATFTNWGHCPGGWNDGNGEVPSTQGYIVEWGEGTVSEEDLSWGRLKLKYR